MHGRGAKHSFHPWADSTRCSKQWSHVRLRQIEEKTKKGVVLHRIWRVGQGPPFCKHLEKSRKIRVRKVSLNRPIQPIHFWILQNQWLKVPVDSSSEAPSRSALVQHQSSWQVFLELMFSDVVTSVGYVLGVRRRSVTSRPCRARCI